MEELKKSTDWETKKAELMLKAQFRKLYEKEIPTEKQNRSNFEEWYNNRRGILSVGQTEDVSTEEKQTL